jgi:hypothetical protein
MCHSRLVRPSSPLPFRAVPRACGALLAVGLFLAAALPVRAAEEVDLQLVLAADVSRSIDQPKFALQRQGYAAALVNPRVLNAIRSGTNGRIAVTLVEWSGQFSQKIVVGWSVIEDETSALAVSDRIVNAPRPFADRTAIGSAIAFALEQFATAPAQTNRRAIDVSGDGTNNTGPLAPGARDAAVAQGVTVNGLVILTEQPMPWNPEHTNPPGGLEAYYRDQVIGGPGAFVMVAEDFDSFGRAIVNKLVAEIAMAPQSLPPSQAPWRHLARWTPRSADPPDLSGVLSSLP